MHIKLNGIIILNLLWKKKVKTNPDKNNIVAILFPENNMLVAKIHIRIVVTPNLKVFLFFSKKIVKNIEKKEKF